ncbi:MAG: Lrp/AsnC ligand binding domain-containing protein [Candidatus Methanosuratincola sp.]|jgi:DNA-binding Lrp family transcriptional regulator|nr:Lrp/AsnC ligand binding domain-containing protein [Candidatus Methanosuratincola sp.]
MHTAVVLINTKRGAVRDTAMELGKLDDVAAVYSVAGDYDLVALVRVEEYERFNEVIAEGLQRIPGIERTKTLMAFKTYKMEPPL